jgi:ABC-type transport system involved in Fe-S cluster assembly fused permease/ATPase subunit
MRAASWSFLAGVDILVSFCWVVCVESMMFEWVFLTDEVYTVVVFTFSASETSVWRTDKRHRRQKEER